MHVYHATSHTTARLALLRPGGLQPGEEALVELVLDDPLFAKHDDRLILRDQSLDVTLGGGPVIHNQPLPGRRSDPGRMAIVAAWAQATPEAAFAALVAAGPVDINEFQDNWGLLDSHLSELTHADDTVVKGSFAIATPRWQRWVSDVVDEIAAKHRDDETLLGIRSNELDADVPQPFLDEILGTLVSDGQLVNKSGRYAPASHRVSLTPAEAALFESVEALLNERQPPSVGDLAKRLRESAPNLRKRLQPLAGKGLLVAVSETRFFVPAQLTELVTIVEQLAGHAPFNVRDFRDAAEIGRNTAIEVLEYLDSRGFTKRTGDTRSVIGDRTRVLPQMLD